jgi:hypothetical protein
MNFLKINYIFNNGLLNLITKNVVELSLAGNNPIQMFYDFGSLIN